ncbi:DUF1345 domain-containing protein [Microbacterium sp. GXS0129]|uniref:DUF1345 domain-containing protein n=1 Tax=Microbacterium sp. GXS0129 TaxID=3377836 RepID=UPI00383B8185
MARTRTRVSKRERRRQARAPRRPRRMQLTILHWLVQLGIASVGVYAVIWEGDLITALTLWCVLATTYAIITMIVLGWMARRGATAVGERAPMPAGFVQLRSILTMVFTLVPAAIGVSAAITVILFGKEKSFAGELLGITPDDLGGTFLVKVVGVWAMIIAWGMLHWGFAQMYAHRSEAVWPDRVLEFPDTPAPALVDHVYFAYTLGMTFAASDVDILTTRTRWTATLHSVLSFLLNALIIALSFNTIMSAGAS